MAYGDITPRSRKSFMRAVLAHRVQRQGGQTSRTDEGNTEASIQCGWGRLLFAPTFETPAALAAAIREETRDQRDIAIYISDPHVVVAAAPQELFLDPSHTFRLDLAVYRQSRQGPRGFVIRRLSSTEDAEAVNRIYMYRHMVPVAPEFFLSPDRNSRALIHLVAEDVDTGKVIGTVTGVDHSHIDGVEAGASLWCLAVDPQATRPGVGEMLVRHLAGHFQAKGAPWLDLSVLHDNAQAIALYEKLGFVRIPFFSVKRKNPINERLFVGPPPEEERLNPYARIIVDEARRRGIMVELTLPEAGYFRLTHGGRSIHCRESLSELTSAVAMSICDDKSVTREVVSAAGVRVPAQTDAEDMGELENFLARYEKVVVKPARGEQGLGVSAGLDDFDQVVAAIARAKQICDRVLVEEHIEGEDLRLVIIDYQLAAAAMRRPARIVGDGVSSVGQLIERQSRRRAAATGGESRIPVDAETERCVASAGFDMDGIPDAGHEFAVRKTANLHTGGTIHDVTDVVHPALKAAAIEVARAISIPVTGVDFMVKDPTEPDYAFIEANERPGLANHEPQPTAQRFVDLLFPDTRRALHRVM